MLVEGISDLTKSGVRTLASQWRSPCCSARGIQSVEIGDCSGPAVFDKLHRIAVGAPISVPGEGINTIRYKEDSSL
jgi:hypothetical protein